MRSLYACFGPGEMHTVVFDKDIKVSTADNAVENEEVLVKLLRKEQMRDATAVGVGKFKAGQVTLYESGKFRGVIWPRNTVSGTWKKM